MKVSQCVSKFELAADNGLRSPVSRRVYGNTLQKLASDLGDPDVGELDAVRLSEWIAGGGRAPSSQRTYKVRVVAFLRWAAWHGWCQHELAEAVGRRVRPQGGGVRQAHWLSRGQVAALLEACDDGTVTGARDRLVVMCGLLTGLRCSELSSIRWSDVDVDSGVLRVVGKGTKPAVVPVGDQLAEEMKRWVESSPGGVVEPGWPVLPRVRSVLVADGVQQLEVQWGVALGPSGVRAAISRRGEAAGISGLRPHDLRRTYAGLLEGDGVPIADVAMLLRHENLATTARYLARNPARALESGRKFRV